MPSGDQVITMDAGLGAASGNANGQGARGRLAELDGPNGRLAPAVVRTVEGVETSGVTRDQVAAKGEGTLAGEPGGADREFEALLATVSGEAGGAASEVTALFGRVLATVHANRPADDLEIIRRAWAFCQQQHEGQKRASGEPYIIHPLEVALVLAELKMDSTAIAAGLLHDAVEDTDVTSAEIAKRFNEQVAHIVEGVTKLDKIKFANREDHQAENIRKMLLAMVTDVRVVIIKLADRLHNMRTLEHLKPEKQVKIARETLDIYAPLAHRLGMGKLRGELEDLAFRYTDPFAYDTLSARGGGAARGERGVPGRRMVVEIEARLREHGWRGGLSRGSSGCIRSSRSFRRRVSRWTRCMTCWRCG